MPRMDAETTTTRTTTASSLQEAWFGTAQTADDSAYASRTATELVTSSSDDDAKPTARSTKRRRIEVEPEGICEDEPVEVVDELPADPPEVKPVSSKSNKRMAIEVRPPPLVHPKSQYTGYKPPLPRTGELDALKLFMSRNPAPQEDGCFYFYLKNFTVYYPATHKRRPCEMVPLTALNVSRASEAFLVDGILSDGISEHHIEGMLTDAVSIEYLDDGKPVAKPRIWIQSVLNSRSGTRQGRFRGLENGQNVWYVLGEPSSEYKRYYEPTLWLADLARFFVVFVDKLVEDDERDVTIWEFKEEFAQWIRETQGEHGRVFLEKFGSTDFRTAVSVHRDWLWNQIHGVTDDRSAVRRMSLWKEILHLTAIKRASGVCIEQTVVTPYVHDCFEELFTTKLMPVYQRKEWVPPPPWEVAAEIPRVEVKLKDENGELPEVVYENPKAGDVVAMERDPDSKWKTDEQDDGLWWMYVMKVSPDKKKLSAVWLYKPSDTVLHSPSSKYPHGDELFFSDHCNCRDSAPLFVKDVRAVGRVEFFGRPGESRKPRDFFIRTKYVNAEAGFVTLKKRDLERCPCRDDFEDPFTKVREKYGRGDTVLAKAKGTGMLLPCAIHDFDDDNGRIVLRVLDYLKKTDPAEAPNELIYTHKFVDVEPTAVVRHCHIRVFKEGEKVVTPYDRNGKGNCFYVRLEEVADGEFVPVRNPPPSDGLRQGFMMGGKTEKAPLRGLDLFCGGGNFGRGLEEGGAVEMKWAVDIESAPLHSYRANMKHKGNAAMYLGSINNYLKDAIQGQYSETIAAPGQVEFISAGSPCQGFSLANPNRDSERSVQNCSLVSSFATAIDIYRPKYAILENVHQLAQTRKREKGEDYNVFSSLLCCIVGMGYQCHQFILDSWSYGDPQTRTRLFLAVSAPGVEPLRRPPRTHQHPTSARSLALYQLPNSTRFGDRDFEGGTPFHYITSFEAMGHLPNIHDDHVGICVPYPDHISSRQETEKTRKLLAYIPRYPYGQGWYKGVVRGMVTEHLRIYPFEKEKANKNSKTWMRIRKDTLCRTITTSITPQCSRTGTYVHYDQPRLLTVQEARIAQGFPDEEVLVGEPAKRFKIVGNSVARGVSMALGVALRKAHYEEWED